VIEPARGHPAQDREGGSIIDTWTETRSLIVLMAVITVCYILGRMVAEML
jgi:hypothetical protein